MADMQSFVMWFLAQLPAFFLSDPISYIVGFVFLFLTIRVIRDIIRL